MSAPKITGRISSQPIREGKFDLRDEAGLTLGTCQHEELATELCATFNSVQKALAALEECDRDWLPSSVSSRERVRRIIWELEEKA